MTPRIGSLFSGYGGLDIAVQNVYGGEVVWYSEIDKHACTVLADRHPGVPNLGDITTVDWADVPPVDILTGGYPCQPFSHAGKREGTNDERHLWPYVRDAIRIIRPRITVLENVAGHLTLGFETVLSDLAELGMSARWGVVRAADAGAPHGRARLFIIVTDPDSEGSERRNFPAAVIHGAGQGRTSTDGGAELPAYANIGGRHENVKQSGDISSPPCEGQPSLTDGHSADGPAADTAGEAGGQRRREPGSWQAESGGSDRGAAADAQGDKQREPAEPSAVRPQPRDGADAGAVRLDWGKYAPAIRRWESVSGRPAPAPTVPGTNGRPRLSPYLVEWMMGLEAGHVTGHGLKPSACLKMLGNGVVPQQAELALRMLVDGGVANDV